MFMTGGDIHLPVRQQVGCQIDIDSRVAAPVRPGVDRRQALLGLRTAVLVGSGIAGTNLVSLPPPFPAERNIEWLSEPDVKRPVQVDCIGPLRDLKVCDVKRRGGRSSQRGISRIDQSESIAVRPRKWLTNPSATPEDGRP